MQVYEVLLVTLPTLTGNTICMYVCSNTKETCTKARVRAMGRPCIFLACDSLFACFARNFSDLLSQQNVFLTCSLRVGYGVLYVFLRGRKRTPRVTPETIPALLFGCKEKYV